jgi:phosphoenolpyruvate synthase/pyruvate phosphate dikinase
MLPQLCSAPTPVTGNRDEVMINASWGLGESIVGGTVTPDTFIVRKSDLAVTQRCHCRQAIYDSLPLPLGTHEVDVPRFFAQTSSSPNDEQVIEMAKLALTLESTMEHPVDVECAYADGRVVFVTVPTDYDAEVILHNLC